ncbi:nitronate monooxygenase family protein [Clostridium tagluense]|uniref:NAD(P)H-dependent flavin oxidoreductase n=1 Tax=Clostridium tagluense TaxID=360422 RepID=UPI001CF1F3AF|nr:nitronate monooxygenase family protein [Clostridium tagluense]MCB2311255.1 nitronate monooxygenase family protein [Clostridium tagluense]MCB2316103.1 nitronate monooxygenase family protein [Clostridium tagluense]MCB2320831.1 nitronate monooxygenase family protein [Clostridium tagluense]MCB2325972.1 nitronate monooxygenase family protein [Clostridium tagluense]MCB2330571.1 nitronate monooxygenase family protein [Clostridium tagluense]
MKLPPLKIGELIASVPIIQGGMGVGVSLSGLASAVANEGGIGIISTAQIGYNEKDFANNAKQANKRALRSEIRRARELSPKGIIGINIMVAMNNYEELVATALEEGIDLIISGAGLPLNLPKIVKGFKTKLAPIVSSAKAATVISKMWDRKENCAADLIVVEGPEAGGHLGFSMESLIENKAQDLKDIIKEVIEAIKPFEEKYNKKIPVIAAGGIYTGADIAEFIKLGAAGVQMATRFVATEECDASLAFKMAYVNSKQEDIKIVKSPVGMPGRAINNEFMKSVLEKGCKVDKCYLCIKDCDPRQTPYCITEALIQAVKGNLDKGLIFVGSNACKVDKIISVKELMSELVTGAELAL